MLNYWFDALTVCLCLVQIDIHCLQFLFQDINQTRLDGEPRISQVVSLGDIVIPGTAPQGKELLQREATVLRQDWDDLQDRMQQVGDSRLV